MFGQTLPDGQRHEVHWELERLDATMEWIQDQARDRWDRLELNALVQAVIITDDREPAIAKLAGTIAGLTVADALGTPFLAVVGTEIQIAEHLLACRARWGISYYVVRELEAFAPVIERLRHADALS